MLYVCFYIDIQWHLVKRTTHLTIKVRVGERRKYHSNATKIKSRLLQIMHKGTRTSFVSLAQLLSKRNIVKIKY